MSPSRPDLFEEIAAKTPSEAEYREPGDRSAFLEADELSDAEKRKLLELDRALDRTLDGWAAELPLPTRDEVHDWIHSERAAEAEYLGRGRRSVKLMLWLTFWTLTLLAGVGLAAALYRARHGG